MDVFLNIIFLGDFGHIELVQTKRNNVDWENERFLKKF